MQSLPAHPAPAPEQDEVAGSVAALVITCEHGGNSIPSAYRPLFRAHQALLDTHRGYDPGALSMARTLADAFDAPMIAATTSRLLVDLNRSLGHASLHHEASRSQPRALRQQILREHYTPYRAQAEGMVRQAIADHGSVIHISSHSFTPVLDGKVRNADISLLYDPTRPGEVALCERWKAALNRSAPELRVRRNYPYAGKGDGLTASLRRQLPAEAYVGIELEINHKHVFAGERPWAALRTVVVATLREALRAPSSSGDRP